MGRQPEHTDAAIIKKFEELSAIKGREVTAWAVREALGGVGKTERYSAVIDEHKKTRATKADTVELPGELTAGLIGIGVQIYLNAKSEAERLAAEAASVMQSRLHAAESDVEEAGTIIASETAKVEQLTIDLEKSRQTEQELRLQLATAEAREQSAKAETLKAEGRETAALNELSEMRKTLAGLVPSRKKSAE